MTLLQGSITVSAASARKRHCVSAGALLFTEISRSLYISDRRCAVNEDTLVGFSRSNQRNVAELLLMMMIKIAPGFWQDRAHCSLAIISCWCHDINWKKLFLFHCCSSSTGRLEDLLVKTPLWTFSTGLLGCRHHQTLTPNNTVLVKLFQSSC